ncbi:hypothetical protein BC629DRAFT_1596449 [Irpex lacteus]|nr:hypothetical protein BC629DRAFT_1596449 [Irpex lacteus]
MALAIRHSHLPDDGDAPESTLHTNDRDGAEDEYDSEEEGELEDDNKGDEPTRSTGVHNVRRPLSISHTLAIQRAIARTPWNSKHYHDSPLRYDLHPLLPPPRPTQTTTTSRPGIAPLPPPSSTCKPTKTRTAHRELSFHPFLSIVPWFKGNRNGRVVGTRRPYRVLVVVWRWWRSGSGRGSLGVGRGTEGGSWGCWGLSGLAGTGREEGRRKKEDGDGDGRCVFDISLDTRLSHLPHPRILALPHPHPHPRSDPHPHPHLNSLALTLALISTASPSPSLTHPHSHPQTNNPSPLEGNEAARTTRRISPLHLFLFLFLSPLHLFLFLHPSCFTLPSTSTLSLHSPLASLSPSTLASPLFPSTLHSPPLSLAPLPLPRPPFTLLASPFTLHSRLLYPGIGCRGAGALLAC